MVTFNFLHLSDLHCGMGGQGTLWPGVKRAFFDDLSEMHDKSGPWDAVIFTGDLSYAGTPENFLQVDETLSDLWEKMHSLGSDAMLLPVPGNHDLQWPSKKNPVVRSLHTWVCGGDDALDIRTEFFQDESSPYRKVVKNSFSGYLDWLSRQDVEFHRLPQMAPGMLPGEFATTLERDGCRIGFLGLNTAFLQLWQEPVCRHSKSAKGHLQFGVEQFHAPCEGDGPKWADGHDLCFLLTHHPPEWLDPVSKGKLHDEVSANNLFGFHFCGHLHQAQSEIIRRGGGSMQRLFINHSLFGLETYGTESERSDREHGYTLIKVELDENESRILFYPRCDAKSGYARLIPNHTGFLLNDDHTDPEPISRRIPDRIKSTQLPSPSFRTSSNQQKKARLHVVRDLGYQPRTLARDLINKSLVLVRGGTLVSGLTWKEAKYIIDFMVKRGFRPFANRSLIGRLSEIKALRRAYPRRSIKIDPFRIAKVPVINRLFKLFVEDNAGYKTLAEKQGEDCTWKSFSNDSTDEQPVRCISYQDARAFCEWAGVRLPTILEFEHAVRGGEDRLFPWGNKWQPNCCNDCYWVGSQETTDVGVFRDGISCDGILDLCGNVFEWTEHGGIEERDDIQWITGGSYRTFGIWRGHAAAHVKVPVSLVRDDFGFRVAALDSEDQ